MRVTIAKITILNPASVFLRDGPHLVPTLLNGAILRVPAFSNTRCAGGLVLNERSILLTLIYPQYSHCVRHHNTSTT
jgi:hypothetical protein